MQQIALILGIVRIKINNNRSTSLERSVINGGGAGGAYTCITSITISFCSGSKHLVVWCVHGEPLTVFYLTRSPKGNDRSSDSQVSGNKVSSVK